MKKTWIQKMEDKKTLPKILKLENRLPCYNAVHKMGANKGDSIILVNASEVLLIMAKVPKGKLITIWEICQKISQNHKVKGCCSLTTGIFIMTIANAAEEAIAKRDKSALAKIPYWRTLKAEGGLNEKYPGGVGHQKRILEKEGHKVINKGSKLLVVDYKKKLVRL